VRTGIAISNGISNCISAPPVGLILLNKDLLSHGFHFPMALSGLGMAFSGTASYLCCRVGGQRQRAVAAVEAPAAAVLPRCCRFSCCSPCAFSTLLCTAERHLLCAMLSQVFKVVEVKKTMTTQFYVSKILPVGLFMALTVSCVSLSYCGRISLSACCAVHPCSWCSTAGVGRECRRLLPARLPHPVPPLSVSALQLLCETKCLWAFHPCLPGLLWP